MYIGIGTLVVILLIILIIYFVRRAERRVDMRSLKQVILRHWLRTHVALVVGAANRRRRRPVHGRSLTRGGIGDPLRSATRYQIVEIP